MDLQLHFSSLEVTDSKNFVSDSDLLKLIPDSDSPTIPSKDLKADLLLDDPECDKGWENDFILNVQMKINGNNFRNI